MAGSHPSGALSATIGQLAGVRMFTTGGAENAELETLCPSVPSVVKKIYHGEHREHREGSALIRKECKPQAAVEAFPAEFGLADLERACPGVSRDMVRRVLRDLQRAGKVVCLGRGPGPAWRKEGITPKRG